MLVADAITLWRCLVGQVLAVVTLNKKSMIPKDAVQNRFAFTTGTVPASPAELAEISSHIDNFYNAAQSTGVGITHWLSSSLSAVNNAHSIDFYDLTGHLDGTSHGSPFRSEPFTLAGLPANEGLPDECAVCISVHSEFGTDRESVGTTRPKARDRGRLYIGPLATGTVAIPDPNKEAVVTPNALSTFRDAMSFMIVDPNLVTWCLWSRADAALKPIVGGFVDNAFDVQRRRGNAASNRLVV